MPFSEILLNKTKLTVSIIFNTRICICVLSKEIKQQEKTPVNTAYITHRNIKKKVQGRENIESPLIQHPKNYWLLTISILEIW